MNPLVSTAECLIDNVAFALVIDDDREMAEEIAESLSLPSNSIRVADSLAGALAAVEENPTIELIVTDFHLTEGGVSAATGEQVIDCISCLFPSRDFEFVVISGDPRAFWHLKERENVSCQSKPPAPDTLLNLLVSKSIPARYAKLIMNTRQLGRFAAGSSAIDIAKT